MNYVDLVLDTSLMQKSINGSRSVFKDQYAKVIETSIQYLKCYPEYWDEHYLCFQFSELSRLGLEQVEGSVSIQNKQINSILKTTNNTLESKQNADILEMFFQADMCALSAIKLSIDMLEDDNNEVDLLIIACNLKDTIPFFNLAFEALFLGEERVYQRGKGASKGAKVIAKRVKNNPVYSLAKILAEKVWQLDGSINNNTLSKNIIEAIKRIYADFHETKCDDFYHLNLFELLDVSSIESAGTEQDEVNLQLHYRYHYLPHPNVNLSHKICVPISLPAIPTLYNHIRNHKELLNIDKNKSNYPIKTESSLVSKLDELLLEEAVKRAKE